MKWRVEFDERAAKEFRKLPREVKQSIATFLSERVAIELDPMRFGKKLTSTYAGLWRYRVENYRIICQIQKERLVVLVLKVGHRREVYR